MADEIKLNSDAGPSLDPRGSPAAAVQVYCRFLRCKEMFIHTEGSFNLADAGSGAYWCSHTQNCLGPDGQEVGAESCVPGRSCHEAW
jgi:hypothetical protein